MVIWKHLLDNSGKCYHNLGIISNKHFGEIQNDTSIYSACLHICYPISGHKEIPMLTCRFLSVVHSETAVETEAVQSIAKRSSPISGQCEVDLRCRSVCPPCALRSLVTKISRNCTTKSGLALRKNLFQLKCLLVTNCLPMTISHSGNSCSQARPNSRYPPAMM